MDKKNKGMPMPSRMAKLGDRSWIKQAYNDDNDDKPLGSISTDTNNSYNNTSSNTLSSGLQQIEDDINGLPLPMGMAEEISNAVEPPKQTIGKVEQLDDDNDVQINELSPPKPFHIEFQEATDDVPDSKQDLINQLSPPVPFNPHDVPDNIDVDAIAKKKVKDEMNQKPATVVSNPPAPTTTTMDEDENGDEADHPVFQRQQQQVIRRPPPPSMLVNPRSSSSASSEQQPRTSENSTANTSVHEASSVYEIPSDNPRSTNQGLHEVEAYLVEDVEGEVYDATLVVKEEEEEHEWHGDSNTDDESENDTLLPLPWYKRHKRYLVLGVVVLVMIVMISVMATLFVDLYNKDKEDDNNNQSGVKSVSDEDVNNDQSSTPAPTPITKQDATSSLPVAPSTPVTSSPSSPPSYDTSSQTTPPPTTTTKCFDANDGGKDGILYNAVRSYVSQDCRNNKECSIGQTYGWPMNSWCVGHVEDMSYLFSRMGTFNEDINGWNTSSVTDMQHMFSYAKAFNRDLSNFDTSRVIYMFAMFWGAAAFNGDVSSFDTSSVTSMGYMFESAPSFNQDVSNFDISRVIDMSFMFYYARSFNQDLCSWRDSFPYAGWKADSIFTDSGCTYQDTPNETQKGPFCASDCQYLQVVSSASIFFSPVLVGVILMIFFLSRQLLVLLFHQQ